MNRPSVWLVLGLASTSIAAADIFRWIDENGVVHYGDSVPERYRRAATTIHRPPGPTDEQRALTCEEQKRRYEASQLCFHPFRNATGGIKAEAFQYCEDVKEPRC